jgi:hypothetical protein
MSVALHGKDAQEKQVIVDTTVQEKILLRRTLLDDTFFSQNSILHLPFTAYQSR